MVHSRTACSKAGTSKELWPAAALPGAGPALRNAIRFNEARLQAVSSRNMYSLHGLEARMSPPAGQVCQSLMLVWNWMPGSAQAQAAWLTFCHSSRALTVRATSPVPRLVRSHSPSSITALRKASVTRTELFEFCPDTEV